MLHDSCTSSDCELEKLHLRQEVARLKRGEFTHEEVHEFCHILPEVVSRDEFEECCKKYCDKLYGEKS